MSFHTKIIELPQATFAAGRPVKPDTKSLATEMVTADGQITVVDNVIIKVSVADTVSSAALPGEDQARILAGIRFTDAAKLPWYDLVGDQSRVATHAELLDMTPADPADLGAGAGTLEYTYVIPLRPDQPDLLYDDNDWGMPLAMWLNGGEEITLLCGVNGDLSSGSSTSALGAGTIDVTLECHTEYRRTQKFRSAWYTREPNTATEFNSGPITGRLRHMFLHKRGADGGASPSGIATVLCQLYGYDNTSRTNVENRYTRSRRVASHDPFLNAHAMPLVYPTQRNKYTRQRKFIGQAVPVKLPGSSFTAFSIVENVMEPIPTKTQEIWADRVKRTTDPAEGFGTKIRTTKKNQTAGANWDETDRRAMPKTDA